MYHEFYEEDLNDAKKILKDYAKQIKEMLKTEKGKRMGIGILTKHSHFNTFDGVILEYVEELEIDENLEIPEEIKNAEVTKLEPDSGTIN